MKYNGYSGKILHVDLTKRSVETRRFTEKFCEDYIGGVGFAAKIIADGVQNWQKPLDEGNPLVFMTGPITGTIIPWSGRHCLAGISPLTGLWGEAYSGGTFARELKQAGYDGIVITGKADKLVYLKVRDDMVTIEDATQFAKVDTYEIEGLLRKECGEKAKIAAIGIAGENLVRFACVINDGPAGRAAARCGLGAVMGSKNLKAMAVIGSKDVPLFDRERLKQSINAIMPKIINDPEHRLKKDKFIYSLFIDSGRNGVHNWRDAELKGFKEAVLEETEKHVYEGRAYHCAGCRTGCVESHVGEEGRLLHWEAFGPLGSQCGLTDMKHVQKAFEICNRYGIDSISAGGVLCFGMVCLEGGLIDSKDADGIELRFGNGAAMHAMLEKICKREGFGAVLAEGVKDAARHIGKGAEQYAIETKGLEVPAHDPRSHNFLALAYATSNRGACHCDAAEPRLENKPIENPQKFQFAVDGMAEKVVRGQHYAGIINALIICGFSNDSSAQSSSPSDFLGLTAKEVNEWFNLATGMDRDFESLMVSGEKIFNLKHLINLKCGYNPNSDTLHERFISLKRKSGPLANHLPQIKTMISDYYRVRGWEPNGKITTGKLKELGFEKFEAGF